MWQKMKDEFGLPLSVQYYINRMNHYRQEIIAKDGISTIKNSLSLVRYLAEKDIKLAVTSISPKREITEALKAVDIYDYFDILISGEEVENSKPAPDIFLKAAQLLNVSVEKCLVIDDTQNGSLAARNAQMYVIGFENPYYHRQDLSAANYVVNQFEGLTLDLLEKLFNIK